MAEHRILITGACGALGRLVCRALLDAGHVGLVAASRSPERLADLAALGVETRRLDFDDETTLDFGFAGVERALVISTDELTTPGRRRQQHGRALAAARRAGVRHVAYTSMPNPFDSAAIPFAPDHADMETALRGSGLAHTVLRNSWYGENLLSYLPHVVSDGTWFTTAGKGRIAYVARADAAEAAARALLADAPPILVDVAGPNALTIREIATLVAATTGRSLPVVLIEPEELAPQLARQGVPAAVIPMVAATEANQRAGRFDVRADGLARLLGRPPTPLRTVLLGHQDAVRGAR